MGAEQSRVSGQQTKFAFHVLRVDEHSPAARAMLVPYFDYIVSVNGVEIIQEEPNVVAEMAKNHVDRPMKMTVYNSRSDKAREVTIIPSRTWGGKTLLGASIRYCQVSDARDRVWHVLDVSYDSPAHRAGLIPQNDWIIGSPEIALNSPDDFYNLMIHNQKRPVRLLVFNIESDSVREAIVIPDFQWGGDGCLGCDVASGALHRIPSTASEAAPPAATIQDPAPAPAPVQPQVQPLAPAQVADAEATPSGRTAPPPPQTNLNPIPGFETATGGDDAFSIQ